MMFYIFFKDVGARSNSCVNDLLCVITHCFLIAGMHLETILCSLLEKISDTTPGLVFNIKIHLVEHSHHHEQTYPTILKLSTKLF